MYIFVELSIEASTTYIYLHQFCLVYNKLLYDFRSWVVVMDDKSFLYNYKSKLIIILASETFYRKINIPCEIFFSGKELPLTMEMKGNERIKIPRKLLTISPVNRG